MRNKLLASVFLGCGVLGDQSNGTELVSSLL